MLVGISYFYHFVNKWTLRSETVKNYVFVKIENSMAKREQMRAKANPEYGEIKTQSHLGRLAREQRRYLGMTLEEFYESSGISTRFMSELERGKIDSVGRLIRVLNMLGLELIVLPRTQIDTLRSSLRKQGHNE